MMALVLATEKRWTGKTGTFVSWDQGFEAALLQRGVNDEPVIDGHNNRRYYEGIDNLTPPTSTAGAAPILAERQRIKRQTIVNRTLQHQLQPA
jgi:hypothetical protein